MILLVGLYAPQQTELLYQHLAERDAPVDYLDVRRLPHDILFGYNTDNPVGGQFYSTVTNRTVRIADVSVAYWTYHIGFVYMGHNGPEEETQQLIANFLNTKSAVECFFNTLDCTWIDPLDVFLKQFSKNHQLRQFRQAGLRVPDTLVTNDMDLARKFYDRHKRQVVCKPCWFGEAGQTFRLNGDFFNTKENAALLRQKPMTFQEYVPGTDILAFVFNQEDILALEAVSNLLDYRADQNVSYRPVDLPEAIREQCITAARIQGSRFDLVDVRRTPAGEYVFFDGTPSPEFLEVEEKSPVSIMDRLADLLIQLDKVSS